MNSEDENASENSIKELSQTWKDDDQDDDFFVESSPQGSHNSPEIPNLWKNTVYQVEGLIPSSAEPVPEAGPSDLNPSSCKKSESLQKQSDVAVLPEKMLSGAKEFPSSHLEVVKEEKAQASIECLTEAKSLPLSSVTTVQMESQTQEADGDLSQTQSLPITDILPDDSKDISKFPDSQLTSQDLASDAPVEQKKKMPSSQLPTSLDDSSDVIFITELQTVKDVPEEETEMKADLINVTLQLSPSQITQPHLDESEEYVSETPEKKEKDSPLERNPTSACKNLRLNVEKDSQSPEVPTVNATFGDSRSDEAIDHSAGNQKSSNEATTESDKSAANFGSSSDPKSKTFKLYLQKDLSVNDVSSTEVSFNKDSPSDSLQPPIVSSQEEIGSAASKQLQKVNLTSTPLQGQSFEAQSSSFSPGSLPASSCTVVDGVPIISINTGPVKEMLQFHVSSGHPVNIKQFLLKRAKPSSASATKFSERDAMFMSEFKVDWDEKNFQLVHDGIIEQYQNLHKSQPIVYIRMVKLLRMQLSGDVNARKEDVIVEDITDSMSPPVIFEEAEDSAATRINKYIQSSLVLDDRWAKTLKEERWYNEKWRFHIKENELIKVDRFLTVIAKPSYSSGYSADVSDSFSSKYSTSRSFEGGSATSLMEKESLLGTAKQGLIDRHLFSAPSVLTKPSAVSKSLKKKRLQTPKQKVQRSPSSMKLGVDKSTSDMDTSQEAKVESKTEPSKELKKGSIIHRAITKDAIVMARYDTNYYPAKVKDKDKNGKWAVMFLEDKICISLWEKDIISVEKLPVDLSVSVRLADGNVQFGMIQGYESTEKEETYIVSLDDGKVASFSTIDIYLTKSQAQILELDIYGPSRQECISNSPISADLNLGNLIYWKRRGASRCYGSDSETPKSTQKRTAQSGQGESSRSRPKRLKIDPARDQPKPSKKRLFTSGEVPISQTSKGKAEPSQVGKSQIFAGFAFLIQSPNLHEELETTDSDTRQVTSFDVSGLKTEILANGGHCVKNFNEFGRSTLTCRLLACRCLQTADYLKCVASGIKCLNYSYINACIGKNGLINDLKYTLPAGRIGQNNVLWHGCTNIMAGLKISINGERTFQSMCFELIKSAGGNPVKISQKRPKKDDFITASVIVSSPNPTEDFIGMVETHYKDVVSYDWLVHSIIHGEAQLHPQYYV